MNSPHRPSGIRFSSAIFAVALALLAAFAVAGALGGRDGFAVACMLGGLALIVVAAFKREDGE